jgi:hypothetical protein
MRHLKKYELFEEVSLTPAKKIELMNLIRQKVKAELEEWISPGKGISYTNQRRISSLIKIAEENGVPNLERTLTEIRKKLIDKIPPIIFDCVTNAKEPSEALDLITKTLEEHLKAIIQNISWAKRKLIGTALRVHHTTKEGFIRNLKDSRLKDDKFAKASGYEFHLYEYMDFIDSVLNNGARAFISKPDYFISSDKKDKSRQNYNKFLDLIDTPAFQKKADASFTKLANSVWDSI